MKKTSIYGFGYLEPADRTGEILDMDQRRFLALENNLLHLYKIFGNGVLEDNLTNSGSSWRIVEPSDLTSLSVTITPGEGHIAWKYAKTTSNFSLELPISTSSFPAKFWIYATPDSTTPELSTVTFVASLIEINNPNYYIGLGAVTVSVSDAGNYVFAIANDADNGRVVISLFNTLNNRINAHKHIGGTRNPSPIDLGAHVQGKLSGEYLSNLDASKITTGTIPVERLPQIDHNNLSNKGTLTHTEIDSLLANLTYPTGSRLSDLFVANMLQLTMALKKQSGLSQIDKNLINAILYLPGYNSDDSFVAYYSTWSSAGLTAVEAPYVPTTLALATIDKTNHRIIGGNPTAISSDSLFWRTDTDFTNAFNATSALANDKSQHIEIINTGDPAYFTLLQPYRFGVISNPETSSLYGSGIFSTSRGWTFAFVNEFNNPNDANQYDVATYLFLKFKDSTGNVLARDFSNLNKFAISYAIANANSNVSVYFIVESGGTSVNFNSSNTSITSINITPKSILYTLESTGSDEDIATFDLDTFFATLVSQRQRVIGMGFYWINDRDINIQLKDADLNANSGKLSSQADLKRAQYARINGIDEESIAPAPDSAMFVWNTLYFYDNGQLIFRFNDSSGTPIFSNVTAEVTGDSNGATVSISTRVAASESALNSSGFIPVNATTGIISSTNNAGNWIDIKVRLETSSDKQSAPSVQLVGLFYIRAGESANKTWDTQNEFVNQGRTFTNVGVTINPDIFGNNTADEAYLELTNTSEVGNYKFLKFTAEGHGFFYDANGSTETSIYTGMNADVASGGLYTTPVQAWNQSVANGLEKPRDVYILDNQHIVIADTYNDRVVEVDEGGYFVRAIQGNVRLKRNQRDLVALTAQYNPRLGKMWISFSQYITYDSTKAAKITVQSGDQIVTFDNTGRTSDNQVSVTLFKPLTYASGAGNGGPDNLNGVSWTGQKTATLEVQFTGTLKDQLNSWLTNEFYLNIETDTNTANNVIKSDGNDGVAYTVPSSSTDKNDGTNLPAYIDGTTKLYNNVGGTGKFKSEEFVSFKGLIKDTVVTVEGDFNDNSTNTDTLMGPDGNTPVRIKVFVGEVVFDNLYSPLSIQVIESGQWVVASVGEYSVNRYDAYGTNIESKRIPYTTVRFLEGRGGSAYLMTIGNNLAYRNLLIAAPSQTNDNGKVLLISQNPTNNLLLSSFTTEGVDAVRAMPDYDKVHYWVALDDVINGGISSRVVKYDSAGNVKLDWGGQVITHPVGLNFTENGDLLVSE